VIIMGTHVIQRDRWHQELDGFSRTHEGWVVRLAVTMPDGEMRVAARDIPLQGVTADSGRDPAIAVMLGNGPGGYVTHAVEHPVEIALEETDASAVKALVIRSADGTRTAVEFRSPMRPEEVDGMP
jgi:hypothetical protein